jgi:transposase
MALVVLSKVEQRLDAVRAVLAGASVTEVAAAVGVSRVSVHGWLRRYLTEGLPGLADRSHRPRSCPHQASDQVAVVVAEMRRKHPRWGAKRIRMELLKRPPADLVVPSAATVNRILVRYGLVRQRKRKRPRESYQRWQRPGPMQLWQLDIVGGVWLVDTTTGVLREVKVVTGVDDHSRFCVIASVVERATGRAVCLALAAALARFGVPEENGEGAALIAPWEWLSARMSQRSPSPERPEPVVEVGDFIPKWHMIGEPVAHYGYVVEDNDQEGRQTSPRSFAAGRSGVRIGAVARATIFGSVATVP